MYLRTQFFGGLADCLENVFRQLVDISTASDAFNQGVYLFNDADPVCVVISFTDDGDDFVSSKLFCFLLRVSQAVNYMTGMNKGLSAIEERARGTGTTIAFLPPRTSISRAVEI